MRFVVLPPPTAVMVTEHDPAERRSTFVPTTLQTFFDFGATAMLNLAPEVGRPT